MKAYDERMLKKKTKKAHGGIQSFVVKRIIEYY